MSTPALDPGPELTPPTGSPFLLRLVRTAGLLLLVAAVAAASAYAVFEWRMRAERAQVAGEISAGLAALRTEVQGQMTALQEELQVVRESAQAVGLLLEQSGEMTGLEMRLAEIDTLKLQMAESQAQFEQKLTALEESLIQRMTQSGQETAQSLAIDMKVRNLLVKAHGEVLLAQIHWAESNRGLAREELEIAGQTLRQAYQAAPESTRAAIQQAVTAADEARTALILESASARDSLNLLWHTIGALLVSEQ